MKRLISTLVLVFAFVLGANAQSNKAEQKSNAAQAEISFEKLEHDYSRVEQGGNGVTEFKYKNTGKVPLMLSKVRSSCGCTVPSWSKEPLMPGQTGTITVKYNTNNVGQINKSITVESNASTGRVVLKIKGEVVKK